MASAQGDQQLSVAIIGSPGHGKSTFMNALAADKKAFAVASGAGSCTQSVFKQIRKVLMRRGDEQTSMNIVLVDTPGFPGPDPMNAIPFFDAVIHACNEPFNAIIWMVKEERACHTVLEQYGLLLREFNNAQPPIIMVVNGMENYDDEAEREEKLDEHKQKAYEFGRQCADAAGISVRKIITSTTKPDLKMAASEVAFALAWFPAKRSSLKSYAELEEERSRCQTNHESIQLEVSKLQAAIDKKESDIVEERVFADSCRSWAWSTCWVPVAGQIGAVGLAMRARGADNYANDLANKLANDTKTKKELMDKDPSVVVKQLEARVERLKKALKGKA